MNVAHYAALSIIIAFLMTGHRSVFPSQLLAMKKSEALSVNLGKRLSTLKQRIQQDFFKISMLFSDEYGLK